MKKTVERRKRGREVLGGTANNNVKRIARGIEGWKEGKKIMGLNALEKLLYIVRLLNEHYNLSILQEQRIKKIQLKFGMSVPPASLPEKQNTLGEQKGGSVDL